MSLGGNAVRLSTVTKQLLIQWDQTKEHWKDAKSAEFESKYLDELRQGVDRAVMVIEQLDKIITKVKKDCE